MKKLMFMLLLAGSIQAVYAQKFSPNTPLFEELTDVKKKTDKLFLSYPFSFFTFLGHLEESNQLHHKLVRRQWRPSTK